MYQDVICDTPASIAGDVRAAERPPSIAPTVSAGAARDAIIARRSLHAKIANA
jgi:hypothetical protein